MKWSLLLLSILLWTDFGFAAGSTRDNWSIGFLGGITTNKQDDMNTLITRANTRVGGISTPQFTNSWEVAMFLQKRFSQSIVAIQLRPSYLFNTVSGNGGSGANAGTYSYKISGYTIMPLLRVHILESSSIKLFIQGGVGWGKLDSEIQEASASVKFSGSNYGFQGGVGVDWCFGTSGRHCLITEGNVRYLYIERNIASSVGGTFSSGANGSLSQAANGREVEIDSKDFGTTFSGIQAFVGYRFAF
ncbi:MAG: hypothetical protein IT289_01680 [Oligoflexia bacterium]|nr:hypothetical protein [Oligoflexia bacterium]